MRSSVLSETNDEVTRQRKLHEKFGDHERSLQEERSIDPDRFSSHSQTAKVRRRSSRCLRHGFTMHRISVTVAGHASILAPGRWR